MYESHWNLNAFPFDNRFDSEFYYPSESHQAALLKLMYSIETRRSAALLCGDSGMGKSMLVEAAIADQLVRYIARQAAPHEPGETSLDVGASIEAIERFLKHNLSDGYHALLVIEEAHLLESNGSLAAVRMLLNLASEQSASESAWSICLVGNIPIVGHLARHPELEDRIAVRCVLERFNLDSTVAYIEHRLRSAGSDRQTPFTERALEAIQLHAAGIPRRINRLCDMAMPKTSSKSMNR
jgi:general secretion pathway protein A